MDHLLSFASGCTHGSDVRSDWADTRVKHTFLWKAAKQLVQSLANIGKWASLSQTKKAVRAGVGFSYSIFFMVIKEVSEQYRGS